MNTTQLDEILRKLDASEIDQNEPDNGTELPDGYYLTEVMKATLAPSKKSGDLQIGFQLRIIENGISIKENKDDPEEVEIKEITGTVGKYIFKYLFLKDEENIKRTIKNLKKFEDEQGNPILNDKTFNSVESIEKGLTVLEGMNIFVELTTKVTKDGSKSQWGNLLSWSRVEELGLFE